MSEDQRTHVDLRKLEKETLIRLMGLPNHLRETMLAVLALGEATATEISADRSI